jgi:hypothetical protein
MTDSQILTLVNRLERCLLQPTEFRHCHHLTVAVTYLYGADLEAAMDKMRSSLCRFVAHHGGNRYHETLTRFWMIQVEKHLDRGPCLQAAVGRIISIMPDKNVVYEYYSRERLNSAEAKQSWIPPDLKPVG